MSEAALEISAVEHRYGKRLALSQLNLTIDTGQVFALLGPNGSGKTTLFRLISTLAKLQVGEINVFGLSVRQATSLVRQQLGVVFQSPSLDPKLTVRENIRCQASLYGLRGSQLEERLERVAEQMGIGDRMHTPTEELSGGLKRRVELAKGILHQPRLLLMDEPSTGLDPASRLDLWHAIKELQHSSGVTVLLTTHLLEEADKANRIAIMHEGREVAVGAPSDLRSQLGDQVLTVQTEDVAAVQCWLEDRKMEPQIVDQRLRVMNAEAASIVAPLTAEFGQRIQTIVLGQPSLEDVFIAKTGHRFWDVDQRNKPKPPQKKRR